MPYKSVDELPEQAKSLPSQAKKIFMAAFNSAFASSKGDEKRAFSIAWAAVENQYRKEGDSWVAKDLTVENDFALYSNFEKFDDEKRMAYGYATRDNLDSHGEIVDLEGTKKAVVDYANWRNIREMHQPKAVGTAPVLEMRKDGLWVGAHIVDDSAWEKVKAGVYKGFSIGGKKLLVVDEFNEKLQKNVKRIKDYLLTEISLVDRPANPLARFSFIKRDVNSSEVESMVETSKDVVMETPTIEVTASTQEVKEGAVAVEVTAPASEVMEKAVESPVSVETKPAEEAKGVEVTKAVEAPVVETPAVSEDKVTLSKAEYEALVKNADLAKKQDELVNALEAKLAKALETQEPKELVQKEVAKPKTIGEVSLMPGGWLSTK